MTDPFTTLGALVGLLIAIILIVYKAHPAYSLLFGALVGGLIGGGNLQETETRMSGHNLQIVAAHALEQWELEQFFVYL